MPCILTFSLLFLFCIVNWIHGKYKHCMIGSIVTKIDSNTGLVNYCHSPWKFMKTILRVIKTSYAQEIFYLDTVTVILTVPSKSKLVQGWRSIQIPRKIRKSWNFGPSKLVKIVKYFFLAEFEIWTFLEQEV